MTCRACGSPVGGEDRFCSRCGAPLVELDEAAEAQTPSRVLALEQRVSRIEGRLPATRLLDHRFLQRAFAVLGHHAVAAGILGLPFLILFVLLYVVVFLSASP